MSQHLSDDRLLDICLHEEGGEPELEHLRSCLECADRRAALTGMLEEAAAVAEAEAEAAFPKERLARQRQRILQEIARSGRPAEVIAFPSTDHDSTDAAPVTRIRRLSRWGGVAAALVASFVFGLLAEHLAHDLPGQRLAPAQARSDVEAVPPAPPPIVSDDEFLGQVELAANRVGSATLVPLDAVTPRAWDVP